MSEHCSIILLSVMCVPKLGKRSVQKSVNPSHNNCNNIRAFVYVSIPCNFFGSQLHPDDTTGEKPPSTDSDRDGMPDVHTELFEEWLNWTSNDNREVSVQGMNKDNASDAMSDFDTMVSMLPRYCWPYPANCTEPGLRVG